MVFSSTELFGLIGIAVAVIVIGWLVTRLDRRVGTPAESEVEFDQQPAIQAPAPKAKPKSKRRR